MKHLEPSRWRGPWAVAIIGLLGAFFLASAIWDPSRRYFFLFLALLACVFAFRAATGRLPHSERRR